MKQTALIGAGVSCSLIRYLQVVLGVCAEGCGVFALINHKRKTVECILNTLIP